MVLQTRRYEDGIRSPTQRRSRWLLADPLDGEWLVGSAEPAAADYKYAPIVSDGEFEVSIPMAEVVFVKGAYEVYVGPQGHYAKVTLPKQPGVAQPRPALKMISVVTEV